MGIGPDDLPTPTPNHSVINMENMLLAQAELCFSFFWVSHIKALLDGAGQWL